MTDMKEFNGEAAFNKINRKRYTKQQYQSWKYCSGNHLNGKERCPADGFKCSKCGQRNHWKSVCSANKISALYTSLAADRHLKDRKCEIDRGLNLDRNHRPA